MQASRALTSYGVHTVVANLLHTRKEQVLVVALEPGGGVQVDTINRPAHEPTIEHSLVATLVAQHQSFCHTAQQQQQQ